MQKWNPILSSPEQVTAFESWTAAEKYKRKNHYIFLEAQDNSSEITEHSPLNIKSCIHNACAIEQ